MFAKRTPSIRIESTVGNKIYALYGAHPSIVILSAKAGATEMIKRNEGAIKVTIRPSIPEDSQRHQNWHLSWSEPLQV